jgi:hypothetical protein
MQKMFNSLVMVLTLVFTMFTCSALAVEKFKISEYGGGHQIWFEAEDYDEQNPDKNDFYDVIDQGKAPKDAFDKVINRTGAPGGFVRWTFDIKKAGGKGGEWYFWGRVINSSNTSDFLLIDGHKGDKIPDLKGKGPFNFPGQNGQRAFEQSQGPPWMWGVNPPKEGHVKELKNGENTMYIFHRQGARSIFWDVFCWSDKRNYVLNDDDYKKAEQKTMLAVDLGQKLTTTWATLKNSS